MLRKNFNVMIPGLQVELKKIKPFRENLKGYRNIFTSSESTSSCLKAVSRQKMG